MSWGDKLFCCACDADVRARLTNGAEVYPRRPDLADVPFWKCDGCGNHVGCHHKVAGRRTRPLGCIPTPAIKSARKEVHAIMDPLWKTGRWRRKELYAEISSRLGREFHTAEIRSLDEARAVYRLVLEIRAAGASHARAS